MKNLWDRLSYLGLKAENNPLDFRLVVLTNRLNFLSVITLTLFFFITFFLTHQKEESFFILSKMGVLIQIFICLLAFYLSNKSMHKLVRIMLAFMPPVFLFIFPPLLGIVEEESFFYSPYMLIILSFIAQLVINIREERVLYILIIILYSLLLIFTEQFLIMMGPDNLIAPQLISSFYIVNKIIQLSIYTFLCVGLYYVKCLNNRFEEELKKQNLKLDQQNEELNLAIKNLKYTQQQLIHSAKMASLGTLASGVAHEINNPLNFIFGGIDIMNDSIKRLLTKIKVDDEGKHILEDISLSNSMVIEGAKRASSIVNSLMSFSSRGNLMKEPNDINKIIADSMLFLKSRISRGIDVLEDYKATLKPYVFSDKMHQVFLSIIDNAIFAVNSYKENVPKVIELKTFESHNNGYSKLVAEFYNTGAPIPQENLSRIFDPFFTTKGPDHGTGLGLSEAFNIVKQHNGEIEVKNISGGVKFSVQLPLAEKEMVSEL